MNEDKIFAIERPHPNLLKNYFAVSLLSGPFFIFIFPVLFFKYHTLRYKFDAEGITVAWGILFKREVHLTYSRIQDIHIISGLIQRWLGIAEIQIQTASGSSAAEITIEGLLEYEELRDFLYSRMRGFKENITTTTVPAPDKSGDMPAGILSEILSEMKASREILEKILAEKETKG